MVERKYSSDSAISQTGRAFTDKIDTNPKKVNSSCKYSLAYSKLTFIITTHINVLSLLY
jgi:hypothetical protein